MANDPWAATNQGLSNLGNTMMSLAQLKRDDEQQAKRNSLIDLQTQQAQQAVDQSKLTLADMGAKQGALIDQYGTAKHTAPLASAYSFQAQQEKETEQRKAAMEKGKYAFDEYLKVAKAVDEGILDENQATTFYNQAMKLVGNDLESAGVKLEFKKQKGGYYTGPVNPESLFMVDGQPTKYGASGVVTAARVVGRDEQTGMPILEMDETTKFEQAKPDQMEMLDRRFEQQQKLQAEQIAAQDRRTQAQIAAADRRASSHTGEDKDYRKQSYQLQKEIRGDKYVNQADDSNQKMAAMENAYAEGKRTGNYTGADQALGYYINKIFDPDSVVMVSEFQRVAQSQGVPDKVLGSLQSVATGGIKLTDQSRDALIRTVKEINKTVQARKSDRLQQYRMDAISLGLDPDKVLAGRDKQPPKDPQGGKGGKLSAGASFIRDQITSYSKAGLKEEAQQQRILQKMQQRGWSKEQIGAAWREYKGQ